mmetsp:Transcript_104874/g.328283  ORF Transcript_104874/g.328283 Transcript_104874/m.328283 type:complete len:499 (+) Transcript_104874:340-1836(+)
MALLDGGQPPGVAEPLAEAGLHLLLHQPELVEPVGSLLRHATCLAAWAAEPGSSLELHAPQAVDLAVAGEEPHASTKVRQLAFQHQTARLNDYNLFVVVTDREDRTAVHQDAYVGAAWVGVRDGVPELPRLEVQPLREQPCSADAGVLGLGPHVQCSEGHAALRLLPPALHQPLQAFLHHFGVRPTKPTLQGVARDLEDPTGGGSTSGDQPRAEEAEQLGLTKHAVLLEDTNPSACSRDQLHGALQHDEHGLRGLARPSDVLPPRVRGLSQRRRHGPQKLLWAAGQQRRARERRHGHLVEPLLAAARGLLLRGLQSAHDLLQGPPLLRVLPEGDLQSHAGQPRAVDGSLAPRSGRRGARLLGAYRTSGSEHLPGARRPDQCLRLALDLHLPGHDQEGGALLAEALLPALEHGVPGCEDDGLEPPAEHSEEGVAGDAEEGAPLHNLPQVLRLQAQRRLGRRGVLLDHAGKGLFVVGKLRKSRGEVETVEHLHDAGARRP